MLISLSNLVNMYNNQIECPLQNESREAYFLFALLVMHTIYERPLLEGSLEISGGGGGHAKTKFFKAKNGAQLKFQKGGP